MGFETSGGDGDALHFREPVHYLKSNIVPAPLIVDPRIPESDNDLPT